MGPELLIFLALVYVFLSSFCVWCPMFPLSMHCPFVISPSVFCNVLSLCTSGFHQVLLICSINKSDGYGVTKNEVESSIKH